MLTVTAPKSSSCVVPEDISHLGDDQLLELLCHRYRHHADAVSRLREVLEQHDGILGIAALPPAVLVNLGLHPGTARIVATAFELGRRVAAAKRRGRPSCRRPEDVAVLMAPQLVALPAEELWVLPLDPQSCLMGEARMASRGCTDGTDASPRAIMRIALTAGATSCIIVHQHPTGDPQPSACDRTVTSRIATAGRAVDVQLVDHVIIGSGGQFTSLRRTDPDLFR